MKKSKTRLSLYKLLWCKIRYYQDLNDISDSQLATYIGVHTRTLKEYDKNAENITLGKLDNFLYVNNISINDLLNY